jgi:hypothetical protein
MKYDLFDLEACPTTFILTSVDQRTVDAKLLE